MGKMLSLKSQGVEEQLPPPPDGPSKIDYFAFSYNQAIYLSEIQRAS